METFADTCDICWEKQKDNLILKGFSEASNEPTTVISDDDDDAPVKIVLLVFNSIRNGRSYFQTIPVSNGNSFR